MTAIVREASAPTPIAFPWMRALPGFVAAGAIAVVLIVVLLRALPGATAAPSGDLQALLAPLLHHATAALWLTVSLLISLASLLFCRRLISTN